MNNIKIILITLIALTAIQCKAQDIRTLEQSRRNVTNATYIKDIDNVLDPFVGTWVLDDGTNYLKMVFKKKVKTLTGNYYQDLLVGEYQYKRNGVEMINTLSKFNVPQANAYRHTIDGNYTWTNQTPFYEYTSDNFRIELIMGEPAGRAYSLEIRTTTFNGQPAIQIYKHKGEGGKPYHVGETPPPIVVPNGFHYLIRQQ